MTVFSRMARLALAALGMLLPLSAAQAQGGELPFDAPVEARLAAGQTHTYTFRSEGNDLVTIRMAGEELDPVLVLYDPAGTLLALNDDAVPGQPEAALTDIPLALPGVYTLVARTYGNRGAGDYTLEAASRRSATLDGSAPLTIGEAVEAELFVAGQVDRWAFEGQAGQVISARMDAARGASLDPLLELLAADGSALTYSDDDGGGVNSLISGFTLPADGTYVLVARAWGHMSVGEYTLELIEGALEAESPAP
ncbi:MAG: PPC domain-containing protein [Anaerolineae bacterium]|nr:PPC domain-containing protein [Anaerolineae bacterium]